MNYQRKPKIGDTGWIVVETVQDFTRKWNEPRKYVTTVRDIEIIKVGRKYTTYRISGEKHNQFYPYTFPHDNEGSSDVYSSREIYAMLSERTALWKAITDHFKAWRCLAPAEMSNGEMKELLEKLKGPTS